MRTGGKTAGAHPANALAPDYLLTFLYQKTLQVTVRGKSELLDLASRI